MKKFFAIVASVLLIGASAAMACDGPECYGSGNFDITAKAGSAALDGGLEFIPNGAAGGVAGAAGGTMGKADGYVRNGDAEADLNVVGGGLVNQTDYRFNVPADRSIGVGSMSSAEAVTQGRIDVYADADSPGWFSGWGNKAEAEGGFIGGAAQGTLDGSFVAESPIFFETNGFSGGIAGQGSAGFIAGGAEAYSGFWNCYGDREAYASAGITMSGGSFSESYRYVNRDEGVKTEGMGTNVGAGTTVNSYGHDSRNAFTTGGFIVGGGAAAKTVQNAPEIGGAKATAKGHYVGAGELNCNYAGSVNGYTNSAVTTFDGMQGSIVSAGSGMRVESHTGPNAD